MNDINNSSINWLHSVRGAELDSVIRNSGVEFGNSIVLEIGAGTGFQLQILKKISLHAYGVELKGSIYTNSYSEVIQYDGKRLPFADSTFDIVYSSNVLEHVTDSHIFQKEIFRVLKSDGRAIHVLPSHFWRIYTTIFHYFWLIVKLVSTIASKIKNVVVSEKRSQTSIDQSFKETRRNINTYTLIRYALYSPRHGEKGNVITEIAHFHPSRWLADFDKYGWTVIKCTPTGIFYWGRDILRLLLSLNVRKILAKYVGSACYTYVLKRKDFK